MQSFRSFPVTASLALVAALTSVGCTSAADVGEACTDSADCLGGLSCFVHAGAAVSPVCMADCDLTTTRICEGGAVCTPATGIGRPESLGVCYLGGNTAIGQPCVGNLECVPGAVCVATGGSQQCYRACRTSDTMACPDGETCTALEGAGTDGFCQAM